MVRGMVTGPVEDLIDRVETAHLLHRAVDAPSRSRLFISAALAAAGVVTLLVAGHDNDTSWSNVVPRNPANEVVVTPTVADETGMPGCTMADRAVAAYMGAEATQVFDAKCDPANFAAQALASNR